MQERPGAITFQGGPLTLIGPELKPGDPAPDFTVLANDLSPVSLADVAGMVCVISVVPSLDTPVCDAQTRRFNAEAGRCSGRVLTISMDLPFAQQRWCGAAGVENVQTLSDHRDASFGRAYGVLIKELRLLARAVFIVDAAATVRYVQIVREMTDPPDYDDVLRALGEITDS